MFVLGIVGGTGSGKTTVAERLVAGLTRSPLAVIGHDASYRDCSAMPTAERLLVNYDHPDAIRQGVDHQVVGCEALMVAGVVAGSVLGGIGAYTLAAPSGARALVTAAGLAPL